MHQRSYNRAWLFFSLEVLTAEWIIDVVRDGDDIDPYVPVPFDDILLCNTKDLQVASTLISSHEVSFTPIDPHQVLSTLINPQSLSTIVINPHYLSSTLTSVNSDQPPLPLINPHQLYYISSTLTNSSQPFQLL